MLFKVKTLTEAISILIDTDELFPTDAFKDSKSAALAYLQGGWADEFIAKVETARDKYNIKDSMTSEGSKASAAFDKFIKIRDEAYADMIVLIGRKILKEVLVLEDEEELGEEDK